MIEVSERQVIFRCYMCYDYIIASAVQNNYELLLTALLNVKSNRWSELCPKKIGIISNLTYIRCRSKRPQCNERHNKFVKPVITVNRLTTTQVRMFIITDLFDQGSSACSLCVNVCHVTYMRDVIGHDVTVTCFISTSIA